MKKQKQKQNTSGLIPDRGIKKWAKLLLKSPMGTVGLGIIILVLFSSIFAEFLSPYDPNKIMMQEMLLPPAWSAGGSMAHFLGTDSLGRDVLTRCIYGARISLLVGVCSVIVAGAIGTVLGLISGYFGGWADRIIMRVADAFHAIPRILLAMVVLFVVGPSVTTLILVIGVTNWVSYARLIRSEVLSLKEKEFVKASRTIGTSHASIILHHILPNVASQFIVISTISVAGSIIIEAAMSFLGLGINPPAISWGVMLATGRDYLATNWWICTFPGVAITITVLGIMFLGNWLRDVLDPKNQGIR
ncbi:MAG: ABC transporter permease [Oscillospiraceae bacterium]